MPSLSPLTEPWEDLRAEPLADTAEPLEESLTPSRGKPDAPTLGCRKQLPSVSGTCSGLFSDAGDPLALPPSPAASALAAVPSASVASMALWPLASFAYKESALDNSSLCVPSSTTVPSFMTQILSAACTVLSRWAMTIVVRRLDPMSLSIASWTTRSLCVSSALVASSSNSTEGSRSNARAMAMRCFCPPLSCVPSSPTSVW
mmetsp:Transcript_64110/g.196101  ORF Transcript_64110/g.196101 Transcript_64110/m.196101 type:complete len:203 (-) Transcript_64110:476-1084(-)